MSKRLPNIVRYIKINPKWMIKMLRSDFKHQNEPSKTVSDVASKISESETVD